MGFTPIFDELCREHAEAVKAHPAGPSRPLRPTVLLKPRRMRRELRSVPRTLRETRRSGWLDGALPT
jgi:hypothetical protein